MAKWRAVHKDITTSWDVSQLSTLGKILFTWGILHADNYGVLKDNAGEIKLKILAGEDCTLEEIKEQLALMEELGLIWRYTPEEDGPLLQFRTFDAHQPRDMIRKRGRPKRALHPDWLPPDGSEGHPGAEKGSEGQSITPQNRQDKKREEQSRSDKSKKRESDAAAPGPSLDILARLECLGIANPVREELAGLEHVTCEYLERWRGWFHDGGGSGLKNRAGYLVQRIRGGDDPPTA